MPEKLRGGPGTWKDRLLQGSGRTVCGAGGAAFLGGTLYFRRERFRNRVFQRMYAPVRLLPECVHRPGGCRKTDHLGTADRDFLELQEQGAHNINLVTPTHYAPWISKALQRAVDQGLKLPVVYNCGGYEGEESLRWMEGLVDIYLTDFKYIDSALAARYSQAPDYPEEAKKPLTGCFSRWERRCSTGKE